MKIALINENSQAPKNALIYQMLEDIVKPLGHQVFNYGRYSGEDPHERSYVQAGLLAGILLNAKAADLVITGCGTGEGAMIACNSFPNVTCGLVTEPLDAALVALVNNCNAVSMPFSKNWGWGAEINLKYVFERLMNTEFGAGYPEAWAEAEKRNKCILDQVKNITQRDMLDIVKELDREFLMETLAEESFSEMFFTNCEENELSIYIKDLLEEKGTK